MKQDNERTQDQCVEQHWLVCLHDPRRYLQQVHQGD